jgi:hypothetical protein
MSFILGLLMSGGQLLGIGVVEIGNEIARG